MDNPQDKRDKSSGQNGEPTEPKAHEAAGNEPVAAARGASGAPQSDDASPAVAASDAMKDLPVVEAPSLDGAQATAPATEPAVELAQPEAAEPILASASDMVHEISDGAAAIEMTSAPQPRSFRFALLAAAIALAAGFGAFVGALSASGFARHDVANPSAPRTADARNVAQALKTELAELNALKASLDAANRGATAQFAKITDRLASLERLQSEPAAKLQRLADAVDRLDRRAAAAPEITGSIARPAEPPPAAAPTPPAAEKILNDWIVRDVRNGRALVESRYGGIFVVASGGSLPGLGRVETVRRQDGVWMVVTAKGTITSDR